MAFREYSPDSAICDVNGNELGAVQELASEAFQTPWLQRIFQEDAHNHPERDLLTTFECIVPVSDLGYYLRSEATKELHPVAAVEFKGEFHFAQQELAFEFSELGSRRFGFAESTILGHPAIWVTSTDEAERKTKLSWRTKDDKPLTGLSAASITEPNFPGLLELQPPFDRPSSLGE
jgi:hypothetical protein